MFSPLFWDSRSTYLWYDKCICWIMLSSVIFVVLCRIKSAIFPCAISKVTMCNILLDLFFVHKLYTWLLSNLCVCVFMACHITFCCHVDKDTCLMPVGAKRALVSASKPKALLFYMSTKFLEPKEQILRVRSDQERSKKCEAVRECRR